MKSGEVAKMNTGAIALINKILGKGGPLISPSYILPLTTLLIFYENPFYHEFVPSPFYEGVCWQEFLHGNHLL